MSILFLLAALPAFGQGVPIQLPPVTDSLGRPIAGATISVFTASGTLPNVTCNTPVTVYMDAALTQPFTTLTTDGFGNFPFFIAATSNPYGYTISGSGTSTSICYLFSAPIAPGASPTFANMTLSGWLKLTEISPPSCSSGFDFIWGDSADHRAKVCNNNGTASDLATLLDFASPPAIGNTTPNSGAFTSITGSTSTVGSSLPSLVTSQLTPFHTPNSFLRQTTETAQPDLYPGALIVNYQPSGGTNSGGKMKPLGLQVESYFNSTGEHGGIYDESYDTGSGDLNGIEVFSYASGMCSDSGGECTEGGRFQADNTGIGGNSLFTGTVATASDVGGSTTITYSTSSNELFGRGKDKVLLRTDGGFFTTGTISSFSGTGTITVTGAGTGWSALGTGAHSDLCLSVDADTLNGFKFVVPITSITDDTHLVLSYVVNAVSQSWPSNQTGAYHLWKCSIVSDVSTAGRVVVTDGYIGWAAAQTFESPVGYSQHMEGVRALVNPAIPYPGGFPVAIFHGVNLSTRKVRGLWFDSSFGLALGLDFQNTWGADPAGNNSGGVAIRLNTNPGNVIASLDSTTATNIFNNQVVGDVFSYNPSTRIFGFGNTGTNIANLAIDPTAGKITKYNGISTVANGVPGLVAKFDATAQAANIAATQVYLVPTGGDGMYVAACDLILTQAATTSSTMPSCVVGWTDFETNTLSSATFATSPGSANTLGLSSTSAGAAMRFLNAKAGTVITVSTSGYASSGATPMQYSAHVKLEYIGN